MNSTIQFQPTLSIIFINPSNEKSENLSYHAILEHSILYPGDLEILIEPRTPETTGLADLLNKAKGRYITFIDESHDVSRHYLKSITTHLRHKNIFMAEPLLSYAQNVTKLDVTYNDLTKKRAITPILPYGIAFSTEALRNSLEALTPTPFSALYLNFRLFWNITRITPIKCSYAYTNQSMVTNGISFCNKYKKLIVNRGKPGLEMRIAILQYLILAIRGARSSSKTPVETSIFREAICAHNTLEVSRYFGLRDKLDIHLLKYLGTHENDPAPFKITSDSIINLFAYYEKENSPQGQILKSIVFPDKQLSLKRVTSERPTADSIESLSSVNYYNRKVSASSVILMFDRSGAADDNAEYFYRWMMQRHPEFSHLYFALSKRSKDWERLARDGFNLVEMFSKDFYTLFLDSDLVISSQMYNLERDGKNFTNSRFLYLQHGIQFNDMTDWVISKHFDTFVVTGRPEEEYMRKIAGNSVLNSGIPRLHTLERKGNEHISFMPTWRFSLNSLSQDKFASTEYFQRIQAVISDQYIGDYLTEHNSKLVVKLHPNLMQRKNLFILPPWAEISDSSYRDVISHSELVITDYSSVVADASFIGIPIAYYQWDSDVFFNEQPYGPRVDYTNEGMGPVFNELDQLSTYVASGSYLCESSIFGKRRERFFAGVDKEKICDRIFDCLLAL